MTAAVKDRACAAVDARAADLIARSHAIHERPELGFEEHFASALIADGLAEGGFAVERSAFDGADIAMMVHPSVADVGWAPHIATTHLKIEMEGKAAHAAAAPWEGVNALDAIVLGYTGVAALRQHLRPGTEKVHGIITDGATAENVVPDYAAAAFQVRAVKEHLLDPLNERVLNCFRGAATQTGCTMHAHRTST